MKHIKLIFIVFLIIISFSTCNTATKPNDKVTYQCPMKCEGKKTFQHAGSCAVCKMDLKSLSEISSKKIENDEISDESIFNLTTTWNTEEGQSIQLKELKGKTLVVVMIYTTCKAACPRLVADMRNIESQIPKKDLKDLQLVMISIDPENDTPTRLKSFAKENYMDDEHWIFLQGTESGVREFANVLAVKYKQISPLDFSHSNIISVFNTEGELIHQQEGLGVDNKETIETINDLVNKK